MTKTDLFIITEFGNFHDFLGVVQQGFITGTEFIHISFELLSQIDVFFWLALVV